MAKATKPDFEKMAEERNRLRVGRAEEAAVTTKNLLRPVDFASTRVRVDDLVENPYNSRSVYLPEQVEDKARSLTLSGQATPILVARMADDQLVVIDGWTRTLASRQIAADESLPEEAREKFSTIEAVIREDLTLQQLAMLSYVSNEEHKGLRDIDRAFAYHKALTDKVFGSQEELADAYRVDRTVVSKVKNIATAPEVILEVVKASPDKLTYSFLAEVLSSNLSVSKQCDLLKETVEKDRSVAWLRGQVVASTAMSGIRTSQAQELKLEAATIKWSPAPRAKTIELVLRTKADQLNMVRLLSGLCAQGQTAREHLAEVLEDEVAAAALIELLIDKDRLQQALGLEGSNQ